MQEVIESASYLNLSATANVCPGTCGLMGIWVSSTTGGTITVYDSATTTTTTLMANTFSPSAATFYPLPFVANNGVYVVLGGTIDCTVAFVKQ